jgi:putative transposase
VSERFWEQVAPLVPPAPAQAKGGRPRLPDRQAFEASVSVLRTGLPWNALPRELGARSTVHDRFQEGQRGGFFHALGAAGLAQDDELRGLEWTWPAADGVRTNAPFGGAATGPTPTERGKQVTKRSRLVEGAGLPRAVAVAGAHRNDMTLLAVTVDEVVSARPEPTPEAAPHLCLDAGYDCAACRVAAQARGYDPHLRSRGDERAEKERTLGFRARRSVVERTHAWLDRARRLLARWEKKAENYLAFIPLAWAQLIFSQLVVSG